ncbi:MAG: hypothetical protein ACFFGZ_20190 [Candidatus Thorarchaeota archaeon]
MQDISFFRASIGVILAPAVDSTSLFIKMTRKTKTGVFEKFSKGEGRVIALNLQEISQALINLQGGKEFNAFHRSPSGVETRIGFFPKPESQLELRLEDYFITLNPAENRLFTKLLEKLEDAILDRIIMKKPTKMAPDGSSAVPADEQTTPETLETSPPETPREVGVDAALLSVIRENFQGGWILSKMLEQLDDLAVDVSRNELLDALELLHQEGFITKEQRTAQAGHTYVVWRFPSG